MKRILASLFSASLALGFGQESTGINLSYMDKEVRAQDDFYNYVNGNWMKEAQVPSDRGRWGSFDELRERTDSISLILLNDLTTQKHAPGSDGQKVTDLYQSIMDTVARNKAGLTPILPEIKKIDALQNINSVTSYFIESTPIDNNLMFDFGVRADMKNSDMNAVYLGAPYLGMSRDYYQKDDEESKSKLMAYQNYLVKLFTFIQDETPEKSAKAVVDFEKKMASNMLSFEELREDDKQYNLVKTKDLKNIVSSVDLSMYLQKVGVNTEQVIIPEIEYYKNLDKLYTAQNLFAIKKYIKAALVDNESSVLGNDLYQLSFDFWSKELNGIDTPRALNKRALSTVNHSIGEAFGKSYVEKYFPPLAKERAKEMVDYLKKAYRIHIKNLSWMTEATKTKALEKLSKFNVKIGYPDKWEDYSDLEIKNVADGGSLYQNMENIALWRFHKKLEKIGKPVDKSKWFMSPQTVNAYYSPQYNEIVFPAAILQPPFFDFKADPAVNFGGIGAVIGHEISHGFDDSGAKYDGEGNLNDWWTPQDEKAFNKLGNALIDQYSSYEPFPGIHVNGKATLGENIADLGGVNVAYDALQLYLKDKGELGSIDGFTQDQRFFISWATIWRTKYKDKALKSQVKTDFHSPGYYRATGPLINVDAFYKAFNITKNDKMYKPKKDRIIIW